MENSQTLATDSFSYSWLINNKPSFDGLLESLQPSLDISSDTVPMVNHLNKILKDDQDFDFNVHPGSRSSISLVHADEIFSDGCIKPVFVNCDRLKLQASSSVPATPISSVSSRAAVSDGSAYQIQGQDCSLNKCKKSSKKFLLRCFGLLGPISLGLGCSRTSIRVDDLDRKVLEVRSRSNSVQGTPDRSKLDALMKQTNRKVLGVLELGNRSISVQASPERSNWAALKKTRSSACERLINSQLASPTRSPTHYSIDESSIHEAILHCKRSFAN